eukprot:m.24632 g.24632  ORF g.24632 m.24632 type:complete len:378 (-) comp9122_c0_seq9:1416-2549(-)
MRGVVELRLVLGIGYVHFDEQVEDEDVVQGILDKVEQVENNLSFGDSSAFSSINTNAIATTSTTVLSYSEEMATMGLEVAQQHQRLPSSSFRVVALPCDANYDDTLTRGWTSQTKGTILCSGCNCNLVSEDLDAKPLPSGRWEDIIGFANCAEHDCDSEMKMALIIQRNFLLFSHTFAHVMECNLENAVLADEDCYCARCHQLVGRKRNLYGENCVEFNLYSSKLSWISHRHSATNTFATALLDHNRCFSHAKFLVTEAGDKGFANPDYLLVWIPSPHAMKMIFFHGSSNSEEDLTVDRTETCFKVLFEHSCSTTATPELARSWYGDDAVVRLQLPTKEVLLGVIQLLEENKLQLPPNQRQAGHDSGLHVSFLPLHN